MRRGARAAPPSRPRWYPHAVSASSAAARPAWSERRFQFGQPPWMLADLGERLRGTEHRLLPLLSDLDAAELRAQPDGAWSILQNAGHLGDVEELWQQRVADLRAGREVFAPADPAHFRGLAEAHQARSAAQVIEHLATRRAGLLAALEQADEALLRASAWHERLGTSMGLVDMALFAAEHDDHHLVRIRELRRRLGLR